MKTYKGFDKDFRCRGFQYEVGKRYKEDTWYMLRNKKVVKVQEGER